MNDDLIKTFYDTIRFPGPYSFESFEVYREEIINPYINLIDIYTSKISNLLDVGCGTGFITNFLAQRYQNLEIQGLDFSESIAYAAHFAKEHNLQSQFIRQNFLEFDSDKKYQLVLCQGVLHHIPEFNKALDKLKYITEPNGYLILGLYHPFGKLLKKFFNLKYKNNILEKDQEENVYERSYFKNSIVNAVGPNFKLIDQTPNNIIKNFIINPINFSISGGLVTYVFQKA